MKAEGVFRITGLNTISSAIFTIPVVVLAWSNNPVSYSVKSIISLVLATVVQAFAIPEFYIGALKSLIYSRIIEMDMLVVISITVAYGYSVVAFGLIHAGHKLEQGEFFQTSTLLITLVLLGRWLAAIARLKAISSVSMSSLQAQTATISDASGKTTNIDARLLQFGDILVISPHTAVVTDGVIIEGSTSIDESMITGESIPVARTVGEAVIAGTLNGPSMVKVRLTRLPGKNSITDIAKSVENALGAKPRIQGLADKIASWFVPAVVGISIVVFAIWLGVAFGIRKQNGGDAVGTAITYGIAVLAISCPCALGLAVPMVLVIAGGISAQAGVIITQGDVIERAYKVTDVVFDKTGTITTGDLSIARVKITCSAYTDDEMQGLVKTLTVGNDHPVSRAVAKHFTSTTATVLNLTNIKSIPGSGISAEWGGRIVEAGSSRFLQIEDDARIMELTNQGMTVFGVAIDSQLCLIVGLQSTIRSEARTVISKLSQRQISCHILSGDQALAVDCVASAVGIPSQRAASRRSPAEKQAYVKSLMDDGKTILFCGDGTNDAAAVAQANVGVQIGSASDVTRATADAVLLGGLEGILTILNVSKRSYRRILFNFAWSVVYNLFAILLASGAFVKVRIPPAYAGLGEIVSVLPVIVAAMSLVWRK